MGLNMEDDDCVGPEKMDLVNNHWNEEFVFKFKSHGRATILRVPVRIPHASSAKELALRLMRCHNLPCYVENELKGRLKAFISKKTKEYQDSLTLSACAIAKERTSVDELASSWCAMYTQEHMDRSVNSGYNADMMFSEVYHALIHSPALETLLQLEHGYSADVANVISNRDNALNEIRERQTAEMETLISSVGSTCSDDDVNALAARQLEESQIQEIYWSSALSELQESQKRDYRDWIYNVHENTVSGATANGGGTKMPSFENTQDTSSADFVMADQPHDDGFKMEESFTIHLGHQMKTMHNIRLLSGDILALCRHKSVFVGGTIVPQPQRLQTAMALYSQSLSALVLLVDNRLQSQLDIKKDFRNVCHQSTDFHFPDLDKQMCLVEQMLQDRPSRTRTVRGISQINQRSGQRSSAPQRTTNILQTGDFYVTRHSNLAAVQLVFHLVTDDSVTDTNINSRHPVMVGLRNVMLAAARNNIDTISIPLLLVQEMTENLTVQWCAKRAELIFKCVKGFMMEGLSWGGTESKTIQFTVPEGISEDLFATFSSMLPTIFRVSTTLDLSDLSRK